jgi:ribosome-binding protein aMBF1 (putative translation factor)
MCLSAAIASWLIPSIVAAAGTGTSAVMANQQAKQQEGQANEQARTAKAQAQMQAEQAPELSTEAGNPDAIKKARASYGIQENILANQNLQSSQTLGNKEQWG